MPTSLQVSPSEAKVSEVNIPFGRSVARSGVLPELVDDLLLVAGQAGREQAGDITPGEMQAVLPIFPRKANNDAALEAGLEIDAHLSFGCRAPGNCQGFSQIALLVGHPSLLHVRSSQGMVELLPLGIAGDRRAKAAVSEQKFTKQQRKLIAGGLMTGYIARCPHLLEGDILSAEKLAALATTINQAHEACQKAEAAGLQHAKEAGDALLEAKKLMEHGGWLTWVKENCKFSMPLVDDYMRVAEHWEECKDAPSFGAAIAKLTKSITPSPRAEVPALAPARRLPLTERKARSGCRTTTSAARSRMLLPSLRALASGCLEIHNGHYEFESGRGDLPLFLSLSIEKGA